MAILGVGGETEIMAQKVGILLQDCEVVPAAPGGKVDNTDAEVDGQSVVVSRETSHRVGIDEWYTVGVHIGAVLNTAFVLGYHGQPRLDGWCAMRSRSHPHFFLQQLAGHIYGRHMYIATWFVQYSYLFIGVIGGLILAGESLKVHDQFDF